MANSAILSWCKSKFHVVIRGECDDVCVGGWYDSSAEFEPKQGCRSKCATICESKLPRISIVLWCFSLLSHLIRDSDKNWTKKQISAKRILDLNFRPRAAEENPREFSENRQGYHEIVAVCFDPIVSCDWCRIDVMFTKRTQEILKNEKGQNAAGNSIFMLLFRWLAVQCFPKYLQPNERLRFQNRLSKFHKLPRKSPPTNVRFGNAWRLNKSWRPSAWCRCKHKWFLAFVCLWEYKNLWKLYRDMKIRATCLDSSLIRRLRNQDNS